MSAVNLSQKRFASPSRRLHSSAPREGRGNCDNGLYASLLDLGVVLILFCILMRDYCVMTTDCKVITMEYSLIIRKLLWIIL